MVPAKKTTLDFLSGGGEMGELIRTMDWSNSLLGDPGQWSQSLRISVSICLNSRFPMVIWWGNDLVKIYNDAYRELIGTKHPMAMGAKGVIVWPEIWPIVGPMLHGVLASGEATWSEDQLLVIERNGYPEDCYFTFSYSPIHDEAGKIGGVFCAVNETTKRVCKERLLSRQLNDLFVQAPVAICILRGPNYIVEVLNERMAEVWGRKRQDVFNKPVFEILHELKDQGFKELLDNVYTKGERFVTEELPISLQRNGNLETAYLKFVYEPLREEDGTISGVMAVADEITDQVVARKKIEESEAFNRTVLESSPDCVKIVNEEGRLLFMNTNGLCNMEIDDFTPYKNKQWWELWPAESQQIVKDAVIKAIKGEKAHFQAFANTAKGTPKWWDVIVMPLELMEGATKNPQILSVSRDITDQKQEALKLEESENRYHTLIHTSLSLIAIFKGEDMIIDIVNDAIVESWGKGSDIIGKSIFTVIPEAVEQGFDKLLLSVYHTGEPVIAYESPITLIRKGKSELVYYTFIYQAQRNLAGDIEGVAIIANEVTPQAEFNLKIKESEAHFRMMADLLPAKISNADTMGNVTYFNKSWLDYAELSFEELRDFGYHQIMHPDEIEEFQSRFQEAAATGSILEMVMRFRNKAGDYKWHLNLASPVKDENGNIKMWVGVTTEIQQQKEQTEKLEDAVVERTQALQKANDEIEKRSADLIVANNELVFQNDEKEKRAAELIIANRALLFQNEEKEKRALELLIANKELEAFTYISSHDLQEPLRKINTFITLLFEKENQYLSHKGKDYLSRIANASKRMQTLIEDLLAYSRISYKELNFENTDLNIIIDEVIGDLSDIILEKNAVITVDTIGEINVNRSQFRQLTDNLIGNALKFSKPGIASTLAISSKIESGSKFKNVSLSPEKNYCHISFSDNGIGFDPQYKDRIFEVFQRLYGKDEYDGTGIGLAIVKKIVENHHGVITATGVINEGARFDIYLPV